MIPLPTRSFLKHTLDQTINTSLSGSSLRWFGPAALTLNGENSFTDGVYVSGGDLRFTSPQALSGKVSLKDGTSLAYLGAIENVNMRSCILDVAGGVYFDTGSDAQGYWEVDTVVGAPNSTIIKIGDSGLYITGNSNAQQSWDLDVREGSIIVDSFKSNYGTGVTRLYGGTTIRIVGVDAPQTVLDKGLTVVGGSVDFDLTDSFSDTTLIPHTISGSGGIALVAPGEVVATFPSGSAVIPAGKLILSAPNTYEGVTSICGGTLGLVLSAHANVIKSGNVLALCGGDAVYQASTLEIVSGALPQTFSEVRVLSGFNQIKGFGYSGSTLYNSGINLGTVNMQSPSATLYIPNLPTDTAGYFAGNKDSWIRTTNSPTACLGPRALTNNGDDLIAVNALGNLVRSEVNYYKLGATVYSNTKSTFVKFAPTGTYGAGNNGDEASSVIRWDKTTQTSPMGPGYAQCRGVANLYTSGMVNVDLGGDTLCLAGDAVIGNLGTGTLNIENGVITRTDSGLSSYGYSVIPIQNNGNVLVSAVVGDSDVGPVALAVMGGGTTNLSQHNTFTLGTTVAGGTLKLSAGGLAGTIINTLSAVNASVVTEVNDAFGTSLGQKLKDVRLVDSVLAHNGTDQVGIGVNYQLTGSTMQTLKPGGHFVFGAGEEPTPPSFTVNAAYMPSTLAGNVVLDANGMSTMVFSVADGNSAEDLVISANISETGGPVGVTKIQNGNMVMSGVNTYTGVTTISAGTLTLKDGAQLASDVFNKASLVIDCNNALGIPTIISGSGTLTKNGEGNATLTGANTYSGTTYINAGRISIGTGGTLGTGAVINNSTLAFIGGGILKLIPNNISGTGAVIKVDARPVALSGQNTYQGDTHIDSEGVVYLNSTSPIGTGALYVAGTGAILGNSTGAPLTITTNNAQYWNAPVTFVGPDELNMGTGGITMQDNIVVDVQASTLRVGPLLDQNVTLTKNGAGRLVLEKFCTYSGDTTVNGGILQIGETNSEEGGTASSLYVINSPGELVYSRAGTYTKTVALSGAGTFRSNSSGYLTLKSTALPSTLIVEGGGTLALTQGNQNLDIGLDSLIVRNQSVLRIDTAHALGGSEAGVSFITTVSSATIHLTRTQCFGTVVLNNSTISGTANIGVAGLNVTAAGNAPSSITASMSITSDCTFNVNAGSELTVWMLTTLSPSTITKTGPGPLQFAANSPLCTSTLNIEEGTAIIKGHLGNAAYNIMNAGTLWIDSPANQTLAGVMSGSGALLKSGSGTLTITGDNTRTGLVSAFAGKITIGNSYALGIADNRTNMMYVNGGGQLDYNGFAVPRSVTIAGSGHDLTGALVNNGPSVSYQLRSINSMALSRDAMIGGTGDFAMIANLWSASTLTLGGYTLTKSGSNQFAMSSTTVTGGTIYIKQGSIAFGVSNGGTGVNASAASFNIHKAADAGLILNRSSSVGAIYSTGTDSVGGYLALNTHTLTVGALNTSTVFGGYITGSGSIVKTGTGELTLTRGSVYSGGTTINGGTLTAGNASAFGSGTITINPGATLNKNGYNITNTIVNNGGTVIP